MEIIKTILGRNAVNARRFLILWQFWMIATLLFFRDLLLYKIFGIELAWVYMIIFLFIGIDLYNRAL